MKTDLILQTRELFVEVDRLQTPIDVAEIVRLADRSEQADSRATFDISARTNRTHTWGWAYATLTAVVVLLLFGGLALLVQPDPGVDPLDKPVVVTPSVTVTTPRPPSTIQPVVPLDALQPPTLEEIQAVFVSPGLWTDEFFEGYAGQQEVPGENEGEPGTGKPPPWWALVTPFQGELLDGGTFSSTDLPDRPTVIVAWYAWPLWLDEGRGSQIDTNLAAFQAVYDNWSDRINVVSIFVPYDEDLKDPFSGNSVSPEVRSSVTDRFDANGYTFPVVVGPTLPDGSSMRVWAEMETMLPTWVLIEEGTVVAGFAGASGLIPANLLLAELDGGWIPGAETSSEWWKTFTESDGLAGDCVEGLVVAGDGTAWVTGPCGVSSFDGDIWTTYFEGQRVEVTLGPDGTPWFVRGTEMQHFEGTVWTTLTLPWSSDGGDAGGFTVTADGTVWVGQGDTLLWSYNGTSWTPHPDAAPEGQAGLVSAAPDGSLWAGTESELLHFDGESWTSLGLPSGMPPSSPEFAPDGTIWLNVLDGLLEYDGDTWTHHLAGTSIEGITFGLDGTVWVASTDRGAYSFNGNSWTRYTTSDGLASDMLTAVAVAPDGTVWFGTFDAGVTRLTPSED